MRLLVGLEAGDQTASPPLLPLAKVAAAGEVGGARSSLPVARGGADAWRDVVETERWEAAGRGSFDGKRCQAVTE